MKKWYQMLIHPILRLAILCLAASLAAPAFTQGKPLTLSPQQSAWLKSHPRVTVGLYDNDWLPFERVKDGQPEGLTYEYLIEATNRLGLKVTTRHYANWAEALAAACTGEVDIVMDVVLTAERARCMVFTRPYADAPVALVSRLQDRRAVRNTGLTGLRLVTERDFSLSSFGRERYPEATHLLADTTREALQMVSDGRADVYLGNAYAASALISGAGIPNIGLQRQSDLPPDSLHFGVPKTRQPLAEALDIALEAIPDARNRALRVRWLQPLQWLEGNNLAFPTRERAALQEPVSVGFSSGWGPISAVDGEGQPSGIVGEYLEAFRASGASHLRMTPLNSRAAIREAMLDGRLDAVMGVPNDTATFGEEWIFSQPFLTVSNVIVVGDGNNRILDMRDLDGLRVALSDPDRLGPLLRAQAPRATIVMVDTTNEGLNRLHSDKVDAYIGNLAVVDRFMRERYSGDLHIVAPAGIEDRLSLAVRPQHAALVSAFDRMLKSMTPREHEAIRTDWMSVEYRTDFDWHSFLTWAFPLTLVLLTALAVHTMGHIRLRREVEQRRLIEKRLADATGNLPAVVYQVHCDINGKLSFPYIAGDMPSLFGIEVELALRDERNLFACIHPDDQPLVSEELGRAISAFDSIAIDFRVRSPEGWKWIRSRAQPHRAEDESLQWSGYWIDVTQVRAQAQALEYAKASAEQAAEAKASFLATMSHEIRTPMSGVLGMLEMLSHTRLDGEQRRMVSVIEESAQMLRQILDDILDFSKVEAGALALEATPISLRQKIDNVQQMLMSQATAKGLNLTNRIDPRVSRRHSADGLRLRQVLFNLLSNAIKFTANGSVTILLNLLEERPGAQLVRLAVRDTGIGIPKDQQAHLFSPFTQAEASTTRRYGGTGLGLSICQRLAELMDGQLELQSTPGDGTEVSLTVWLETMAADVEAHDVATTDAMVPTPPEWQRKSVLIVEDHPTNQDLMRWRMRQLGLNHEVVNNGSNALAALRCGSFDAIITDCRMPEMDGYQMTREIRRMEASDPLRRRIPIIALTASVLDEEARRCEGAGMDDFLAKPVPLAILRGALLRWLQPSTDDAEGQILGRQPDAFTTTDIGDGVSSSTESKATAREELIVRFGSAQVAEQMISSIVSITQADIRAMDAAIAAHDARACVDHLHRIAGGLGTMGFIHLSNQVQHLQAAIEADGIEAHRSSFSACREAVMQYLHHLQS